MTSVDTGCEDVRVNLSEYSRYDGLGLAGLAASHQVSPQELADTAAAAIAAVNPRINAVIETYEDRLANVDTETLGSGPFRGVPLLIKDVGGHEKGRKIEFCSRLCEGMVSETDSNFALLLRRAGVNIVGRTNTPEYSMASSSENALYGDTHTPWKLGHSAGGSSGGAASAVAAGIVPIAHGSDIAGSIRIPASWCGGVGLKPSRGRVSSGPVMSEAGWGMAMSFIQATTMRDAAAMLDCLAVPQPGDPFVQSRPAEPYASFLAGRTAPLRIAFTVRPTMNAPVDPEVTDAVRLAATTLAEQGHDVFEADPPFDQEEACHALVGIWFFGFHRHLDSLGERSGRRPGPDTLEPITWKTYERARDMEPYAFLDSMAWLDRSRRALGRFFTDCDVLISPTTAQVSPRLGRYGMNFPEMDLMDWMIHSDEPVQYCFMYNVMGAPALSLPLAMHSSGLPIGVQLGARPSDDHLLIALGSTLEQALPWRGRVPTIHASRD